VDADRPLKELFRLRPRDLLDIIGDAGAVLISSEVAEVQSLSRRVDSALRLRRGRERYVRHLEFEMKYRKGLELRCFEYAALLAVHFRLPILTTVVLVEKSGPRELAYREILGGRVVHERRFDVVRLWEMDPEKALRFGPGAAALVGPAEKTTLPLVGRAAHEIQRETKGAVQSDLLFVLQALSRRRYTAKELEGVIPKETVMASSLWAEAAREGRKRGREEGRQQGAVAEARAFCIELAREHPPEIADRVVPLIDACSDVERLHKPLRISPPEAVAYLVSQRRPARAVAGASLAPPGRRSRSSRGRTSPGADLASARPG